MSKEHNITLISLFQGEVDQSQFDDVRGFCASVYLVELPRWKPWVNLIHTGLFSQLPLQVGYYWSKEFQAKVKEVLEREQFDVVHAFMLRLLPYLTKIDTPVILDLNDSMALNLERRITKERGIKKLVLKEELKRVSIYESNGLGAVFQSIVVSELDKSFLLGTNSSVIPLGIDVLKFCPDSSRRTDSAIIFSGNLSYHPNVVAIKWFVEKCFEHIRAKHKNATLTIAGINPPKEVLAFSNRPGIRVTGFVDSMPDTLNCASVAIAPMQTGSGMQFKILEAMSCGLPVVTTSLGLGDIKAANGRDVLVADGEDEFIGAILKVLSNREMAIEIGTSARRYVETNHSWQSTANQVGRLYKLASKGQVVTR